MAVAGKEAGEADLLGMWHLVTGFQRSVDVECGILLIVPNWMYKFFCSLQLFVILPQQKML